MPKQSQTDAAYGADLAAIHDAGFGAVAAAAAEQLLALVGPSAANTGKLPIVDLGCGSGILAARVEDAGYHVLGYDISPDMITLARRRSPRSEFHCGSFLAVELPRCRAITAVGEIFNYLFDVEHSDARLWSFFRRVHAALDRGGLFLFDMAGPGRTGKLRTVRNFTQTDDWACLYAASEDPQRRVLSRDITTFRRADSSYRRYHETHRLRLYSPAAILARLRAAGFKARRLRGYGEFTFPRGWAGFLARKP